MGDSLSTDSLNFIANLINEQKADLKAHFANELRMIKTTVQENHNLAIETRDLQKITNGRVNKLDDAVFGEYDKNCNKVKGREGLIHDINKVKYWSWFYSSWKTPAVFLLTLTAIYIEESRLIIVDIINKIL